MNKFHLSLSILVLLSLECYSQESVSPELRRSVITNGIGLGSVIAVVTSWERNKSILWAILHSMLSWVYVIHFAITRMPDEIN